MKYCIANWKAHKTWNDAVLWTQLFLDILQKEEKIQLLLHEKKLALLICPPLPFISGLSSYLQKEKNIFLCAQNISHEEKGNFTGEVTAEALSNLVQFSLIGHSERRRLYKESDDEIKTKYALAEQYSIVPVLCISNELNWIPQSAKLVAYEPQEAIGSGNNEPLEKVLTLRKKLNLSEHTAFLYGGSVDESNVQEYIHSPMIDGLLVGTASLDPQSFISIIRKF